MDCRSVSSDCFVVAVSRDGDGVAVFRDAPRVGETQLRV